jgi:allantoate deiminase
LAIAAVEGLHDQKKRLPYAIEVVAFCDEEGTRYQSTYLGSRVLAGTFPAADLERLDAQGIRMADAILSAGGNPDRLASAALNPAHYLGYFEAHIEQGPVLETHNLAVGVVTGIAGQSRIRITFTGQASHAGTTPMNLRKDALCAAAEFVLEVERTAKSKTRLVATVGELRVPDGAGNVVPGQVILSLDLRHGDNEVRREALDTLQQKAQGIAAARRVDMNWEIVQESSAVKCSPPWIRLLSQAVTPHQHETLLLDSGAGHDAAALSAILPVCMLFVRCTQGLSHHPDEYAAPQDIGIALTVLDDFLQLAATQLESLP